ncbi:MAG: glycosyltransferase family 2 protein, partial [Bacteroidota bacterium]
MPDKPLVSVLITAYNREKLIVETLESVLECTYKNIEIIIVDDGSKDNTLSVIKEFAEKDSRIRYYQNEKNLGDYPNRNKAASYARGEYIAYL